MWTLEKCTENNNNKRKRKLGGEANHNKSLNPNGKHVMNIEVVSG